MHTHHTDANNRKPHDRGEGGEGGYMHTLHTNANNRKPPDGAGVKPMLSLMDLPAGENLLMERIYTYGSTTIRPPDHMSLRLLVRFIANGDG